MEKYMLRCRMILVCENIHKLIMPIRSRCINIRVPAPSKIEIADVLFSIAKSENLTLPEEVVERIVESSRRNLRDAICQL